MSRLPSLLLLAVLALPAQLFAQETRWGSVVARFVYDGDSPRAKTFSITRDNEAFGSTIDDESLMVHAENGGIANVVAYLLPADEQTVRVHPSYEDAANAPATLIMSGGRFEPHILLMRTSQTMVQKNMDKVRHHARIDFFRNTPM